MTQAHNPLGKLAAAHPELISNSAGAYSNVTFPHEAIGIRGVGKRRTPMINMDKYIDTAMNRELHDEICRGLALAESFEFGLVVGSAPPAELLRGAAQFFSETLRSIDAWDADGRHVSNIDYIVEQSRPERLRKNVMKYCCFMLGSSVPWFFTVYLRRGEFVEKTSYTPISGLTDAAQPLWEPIADHFPKLKRWITTLPFKSIGRALLFCTYPGAPVPVHRDFPMAAHKDHNINCFFEPGWRPSFVYDEIGDQKHYLEKGATAYFFNNRDYHGVDAQPCFRYTFRIDGTFTDELCEELGMEDGFVYRSSYDAG
ncbi:MAG TPA: hypothetical protein VI072_27260 [Polyangiaceae bacterium]